MKSHLFIARVVLQNHTYIHLLELSTSPGYCADGAGYSNDFSLIFFVHNKANNFVIFLF